MLCSFFGIIGDPSKGFFCYAQGYSSHFFCVASFLWTTTIAFTLHRTVVRHKTYVEDLEAMFHLYAWASKNEIFIQMAVHFITFYMPLWGAILYNGFTYFQVIRMLNNATRMAVGMSDRAYASDARDSMRVVYTALNRWGYYPLILIGSWAFGIINRIHDFIEPGHKIFWLSLLDVGTAALMILASSTQLHMASPTQLHMASILLFVDQFVKDWICKFLPERLRRWLPNNFKYRNQQQESELVLLRNDSQ
ncbi:hypothetical protein Lal_00004704 [Lupinus albus]|nr:hypothetical protein Lal_00004704 [Lupinus albus]